MPMYVVSFCDCMQISMGNLTRIVALFDVAFLRKGCKCDDRCRVAHLTNQTRALKTIEVWHLQESALNSPQMKGVDILGYP